jgi:hypothetical protein
MLSSLPNDQIFLIGLGSQIACAVGVWFVGRWSALAGYALMLPVFWIVPFVLASGHMLIALDGIVIFPIAFLGYVCTRRAKMLKHASMRTGNRTGDGRSGGER